MGVAALALLFVVLGTAGTRTPPAHAGLRICVSPDGGQHDCDGRLEKTRTFVEAVELLNRRASSDDLRDTVVTVLPGIYGLADLRDPADPWRSALRDVRVDPDRPVVIRGMGRRTVIRGDGEPKIRADFSKTPNISGRADPDQAPVGWQPDYLPGSHPANCLEMHDVSGVVIESLTVQGCWPAFLFVKNGTYVSVRDLEITGSTYAIAVRGGGSHHFLIEHNRWIQDCTAYPKSPATHAYNVDEDACLAADPPAPGKMWKEVHWRCSHHNGDDGCQDDPNACNEQFCAVTQYEFFNGGLFGAKDIPGGVVFRGNAIWNAFNGMRTKATDASGNRNVEIYGNAFHHVRDNPIEPEEHATNWRIHHNRIHNAHAWFSFDWVAGSDWYVYGNVGWFDESPDSVPGRAGHCNRNGRVLKFRESAPFPAAGFYVFNNSWYLRAAVANHRTQHLTHWNNAIRFCVPNPASPSDPCRVVPDDPRGCVPRTGPAPYVPLFDPVPSGSPPELSLLHPDNENWFESDRSNHADFPSPAFGAPPRPTGREAHGEPLAPPFVDPARGDLRMRDGAWADAGIPPPWQTRSPSRHRGLAPPIGAYDDGDRLLEGPPYVHAPLLCEHPLRATCLERPRVMGHGWGSGQLAVAFSVPIRLADSDRRLRIAYAAEPGSPAGTAVSEECEVAGSVLACPFREGDALSHKRITEILLPRGITDQSGMPMTLWARASPIVKVGPPSPGDPAGRQ